jgi:ADP-ribose pyrophosphatase
MKIKEDRTYTPGEGKKFLKYIETDYIDNSGNEKVWQWASRQDGTKSVVIVAIVGRTKIAVIEEYRIPLKDVEIGLPAGLIEPGDNILETVKKELFQETNLEVSNIWMVSPFLYNSPGITDEQTAIAFVTAYGEVSNKNTEASEDIVPKLLDIDDVVFLIGQVMSGQVKMGFKAWFALMLFANGQLGDFEKINDKLGG